MNTIKNLIDQYTQNNVAIKKKEDSIKQKEATIERLKKQISKMSDKNSWIKIIIEPMAQELSQIINMPVWEVLGPFGLDCETSIHFALNEDDLNLSSDKERNIKSITFVPIFDYSKHDYEIGVRDYSVNTNKFKQGSIGEVNGGNHPITKITTMPLSQIAQKFILGEKDLKISTDIPESIMDKIINPDKSFNNYDNKAPKQWDKDNFVEYVKDYMDHNNVISTSQPLLKAIFPNETTMDMLNNGSGLNNNKYFNQYDNWRAALYDIWEVIKK